MNLATSAFNRSTKVSKSQAMKVIEELAASHPNEVEQLGKLYRYFMPNMPVTPKTAQAWVCKAVAKNDVRYYLNRLEVLNGWLAATDGHRLHMCKTTLEDGAYDTQFNMIDAEDAGQFPDVKRAIPNHKLNTKLGRCKIVEHIRLAKNNYVDVMFDDNTTIRFKLNYWKEATCGFADDATVQYPDQPGSIFIENGERRCLLMAVR